MDAPPRQTLFQNGAHEDGRSPAPDTCFHQVAWNTAFQNVHNACLQAIEPKEAYHGFRLGWPVSSLNPVDDHERARGREIVMEVAIREKYSRQAPLQQIEVQLRGAADGMGDRAHNLIKCEQSHCVKTTSAVVKLSWRYYTST